MNNTALLIEKVELLIQLLAGTEAGESETVKDIYELIGKFKKQESEPISLDLNTDEYYSERFTIPKKYHKKLAKLIETLLEPTIENHPLIELKNPENPK